MQTPAEELTPSTESEEFHINIDPKTLGKAKEVIINFLLCAIRIMFRLPARMTFSGNRLMREKVVCASVDYIYQSRMSAQGQTDADIRAYLRGNPMAMLSDVEINAAFKRAGPRTGMEPTPGWLPDSIRRRYKRPVIAHPAGAVVHDGDCHIFSSKICTCGLLHMLCRIGDGDGVVKVYPKYYDEYVPHDTALREMFEHKHADYSKNVAAGAPE